MKPSDNGRITFDLPDDLRRKLIALAETQDRSVSALCRSGVMLVLAADDARPSHVAGVVRSSPKMKAAGGS